jgi:hypothetical protein
MNLNCPKCGKPAKKSLRLISLAVVFSCVDCDIFHVADSGAGWIKGGDGLQARLLNIAKGVEESRNRWDEMIYSAESDPRWTWL